MTLVPSGQDGCTQFSLIFYHITQNDTDLEIMCDMKSSIYDTECREYSNTPKILINTSIETKGNEWRLSPIIIYDKDGIINSHNFTMQGSGKTIQLLCMASTFSAPKLAVLNWCVRKNDQVIWNRIVLQEEEIKAFGNDSVESVKFSRIIYHMTQYDRAVHFRCEVSKSSLNACGTGLSFVNVTISKKEEKNPIATENQRTVTAGTTVLSLTSTENHITSTVTALAAFSVLLCILLALVVLFVITTYRREETTLFGFIIKIKQKNKETEEIQRKGKKINNSLSKERGKNDNKKAIDVGFERQGFYENEVLKYENAKEASTGKTEYESCKYEELQVKEKEQDYDELNLTKI
ncbi:uncharacterized protein LOC134269799 isoform X2 [Saccostrea cucullata]|uniref:uncharacterized protein LOC134269799 isoform X2 n=1 Tax=Saccostrea cuccullata TaxID=36930 RepID=UPI002ED63050